MKKEEVETITEMDPWEIPFDVEEGSGAFGIIESLNNSKGTGCHDCLVVIQQLTVQGDIEAAVLLAQAAMMQHVCVD